MGNYLTRDTILTVQDYQVAEVDVPEWGGVVLVRELTAAQAQHVGFTMANPDGTVDPTRDKKLMTRIVSWAVVDAEHKPLFTEHDIEALGQKAYAPVERISSKALELSGLSESTDEKN